MGVSEAEVREALRQVLGQGADIDSSSPLPIEGTIEGTVEPDLPARTDYITQAHAGFNDGAITLGDTHTVDVNAELGRDASEGWIYCHSGTLNVTLNGGEVIVLVVGAIHEVGLLNAQFEIDEIEITCTSASAQYYLFLT